MRRCTHCGKPIQSVWSPRSIESEALDQLERDLAGVPEDCWRFFNALFCTNTVYVTVRAMCDDLGISHSTLNTRFGRAGLPSPRTYLMFARLTRAARFLEDSGRTSWEVALMINCIHQRAFLRLTHCALGCTNREFRSLYTGDEMFALFRKLVLPYVTTLRAFRPLQLVDDRQEYGVARRSA